MYHERSNTSFSIQAEPSTGGAINGMIYAIPVATLMWAAIAGIAYLVF